MAETGSTPSFWSLARRSKRLQKGIIYAVPPFLAACLLLLLTFSVAENANQKLSLGVVGVLCLVLVVICLRSGIHEAQEWRRLAREGIPGQGVVTLVKQVSEKAFPLWLDIVLVLLPTRNINDEVEGWVISYRYDGNGTTYSGESGFLPRVEAERWHVGDTCAIQYDAKQPEKSVWIGKP